MSVSNNIDLEIIDAGKQRKLDTLGFSAMNSLKNVILNRNAPLKQTIDFGEKIIVVYVD